MRCGITSCERRSLVQMPTLIFRRVLVVCADCILCIGHLATYQLQDKMIPQVMNRQRVSCDKSPINSEINTAVSLPPVKVSDSTDLFVIEISNWQHQLSIPEISHFYSQIRASWKGCRDVYFISL